MSTFLFGLIAVLAGIVFCFRGYLAFRIVIPVWGAFVGFAVGAGLTASLSGDSFLANATAWFVAFAVAVVFGLLAYFFFEVAVAVAMGSIGFSLGTTLMLALGIEWTWLIVLIGVVAGVALAFFAIVAELPMILLLVLSALGGASAIVTGLMLWTGAIGADELSNAQAVDDAADGWWWYAAYFGLALAGVIIQLNDATKRSGSMRDAWGERRAAA